MSSDIGGSIKLDGGGDGGGSGSGGDATGAAHEWMPGGRVSPSPAHEIIEPPLSAAAADRDLAPPRADDAAPPGDVAAALAQKQHVVGLLEAQLAVARLEEVQLAEAQARLAADPPSLSPPPLQPPSVRESEEADGVKNVKQWSTVFSGAGGATGDEGASDKERRDDAGTAAAETRGEAAAALSLAPPTPVVVAPAAAPPAPAVAVVARPYTPAPLRVPGGERFQVAPPWAPPAAAYAGQNKVIVMPSCGLGNRMRSAVGAVVFAKSVGMPITLSWNEIIPHVKERLPFGKIFGDAHPDFTIKTGAYTYSAPKGSGLRYLQRKVSTDEAMCYGCSNSPPCVPCSWHPEGPRPTAKDLVFFGCGHCLQDDNTVDSARAHGQRRMCADIMARFPPPPPVEAALRSMNLSDIHDVGVHIRGGDKRKFTKKGPKGCDETTAFVNAMRKLPPAPDGVQRRFFVASDSHDWVEKIGKQFPSGVVVSAQHHEAAKMKDVHPLAFDIWGLAKASTAATAAAAGRVQRQSRDNNEEISIERLLSGKRGAQIARPSYATERQPSGLWSPCSVNVATWPRGGLSALLWSACFCIVVRLVLRTKSTVIG
jgi:hypothetical protein